MPTSLHPPAYHIFIDEFGDHRLKATASEWFILSAVVIQARREPDLPRWIAAIKKPMKNAQRPDLHFQKLDLPMKLRACRFIGKLPVRIFTLISHKENMLNHRNPKCEAMYEWREYHDDGSYTIIPRTTRYPNFVLKVLLERATAWCETRSYRDFGEPRPVSILIAQRGGFYLEDFLSYLHLDHRNMIAQSGTLPRYLAWSVVDHDCIKTAPAANSAGLQLADVVSGAFSRAVDENRFNGCDRRFAELLEPRLARRYGKYIAGTGVTGLPWKLWEANMSAEQEKLFRRFGYRNRKLVRPGPILPSGR